MNGPLGQVKFRLALDEQWTLLSVSEGVHPLLGFSAEDFLASRVRLNDLIHKDDANTFGKLFLPHIENRSGTFNIRIRNANGKIRCIVGQFTREWAGAGSKEELDLLLQDAKDLYRTRGEPASLTTIEPLMEMFDELIYFKNRSHVFTAANRQTARSLSTVGCAEDLLGLTDYDLYPEEYADARYRLESEALARDGVACDTEVLAAEDGKKRWVENRIFPVKDPDGEVIGLFGMAHDVTERREVLEKLRQSEESLLEAQRIAGIGSYVTDIKRGVWTSSEVMDHIFGIGKEYDRSVDGWALLVHPDDRESMVAYFVEEVIGQGKPFDREYHIVRASDGVVRWVHGLGRLERDDQRRPETMLGTIQDITERRQAEAVLRESKELLQLFIEHAPAALAMLDREMHYLAVSRCWLEMHPVAGREVVGCSHYEVMPEIPEDWREEHRRVLAGEMLPADEKQLVRADGTVQWIRRRLETWHTGDGAVGGLVIFAEDITRQKETEERLRLAASVFTNAREGILITDRDGVILEVNDTFTRMSGYERDEVLGQNPRILKSGLQSDEFYAGMWGSLREDGEWSGEIWNRNKNGEVYAQTMTITSVHDVGGKLLWYVALLADITQLKKHAQQLEHMAHYDVLTSLPNRALLSDRLQQAMAQAQRRKQMLAVAVLDLDAFKGINDLHGRGVGDRLLTSLAFNIKCALREGDTLARLGGDEFVAVLLDLEDAGSCAPVLSQLLEAASELVQIGDLSVRVSASLGVTFYPAGEEADADQLLRQADQAMYQAKLAGGNRYHIFDPDYDQTVRGRHENFEHIRHALAAQEFVLYYQPKMNMRSGKMVGAEALIRWQHPERGLLPPGMFLPVIENDPLAIELGEWVIDSALAQMEAWKAAGLEIPVSVNVGALQLQQADFVDRLSGLLAAHPRVKPFSLEIEILETSALQDVVQTSQVLNACRGIGVSFALDDFGTGYSSLTYLKRLPASILKIDQSFVSDMLGDPENLNILEGILELASAFHRQVIAEGVESVEHGLMLLQLGCELAQGYGIARPMPASDLPGWLSSWRPDPRWAEVPVVHSGNREILYAGVAHRAWIAAFEAFLQGKRHSAPPMEMRECRFVMWLDAERQTSRGKLPEYQCVEDLHRQLHELAEGIASSQAQGRGSEDLSHCGELHRLCDRFVDHLEALRQAN